MTKPAWEPELVTDIVTEGVGTITYDPSIMIYRKWYDFKPQCDITLWELAQVVAAIQIGMAEELVKQLHPDVQRHWEEKND